MKGEFKMKTIILLFLLLFLLSACKNEDEIVDNNNNIIEPEIIEEDEKVVIENDVIIKGQELLNDYYQKSLARKDVEIIIVYDGIKTSLSFVDNKHYFYKEENVYEFNYFLYQHYDFDYYYAYYAADIYYLSNNLLDHVDRNRDMIIYDIFYEYNFYLEDPLVDIISKSISDGRYRSFEVNDNNSTIILNTLFHLNWQKTPIIGDFGPTAIYTKIDGKLITDKYNYFGIELNSDISFEIYFDVDELVAMMVPSCNEEMLEPSYAKLSNDDVIHLSEDLFNIVKDSNGEIINQGEYIFKSRNHTIILKIDNHNTIQNVCVILETESHGNVYTSKWPGTYEIKNNLIVANVSGGAIFVFQIDCGLPGNVKFIRDLSKPFYYIYDVIDEDFYLEWIGEKYTAK